MSFTLFSLLALLTLSFSSLNTHAQVVLNGQVFTNGLAIIDAPQPGTTLHAGATQSIAIDVSGDGHLPSSAYTPGSTDSTRFDELEVYLVSYQTSLNLTVSSGTGLLAQESGSTVKHINWQIDNCIKSGNYNLTFYEGSHINGQPYFIITPIPIVIQNTSPLGSCSNGTNSLQAFPQTESAPSLGPWLDSNNDTVSVDFPNASGAGYPSLSFIALSSCLAIATLNFLLA